jgi:preprotein translocase subunit SecF
MTTTQWLAPMLGVVMSALITAVGLIVQKRMNRSVDQATAYKTNVDAQAVVLTTTVAADKLRAETEQMRVKTSETNVDIARALLTDLRIELDRQKADAEDQRAELNRVRRDSEERYDDVCRSLAGVKAALRAHLHRQRVHMPWDRAVYLEMLKTHPDYPEAPPLSSDEDVD